MPITPSSKKSFEPNEAGLPQLRQQCWARVRSLLVERLALALDEMEKAQQAAAAEEKSSAGDKYETGRAMSQNRRDLFALQVSGHRAVLEKIPLWERNTSGRVSAPGSLLLWNGNWYLLGPGLGAVETDDGFRFFAVSVQSPIGMALNGKQEGESAVFGGVSAGVQRLI